MVYHAFADLVLVLHLLFILFAVAGGLLALRWTWAPLVHLPSAAWGVFIEVSGGICPLTPLENALRRAAGESGYSGGFIEHYLLPLIYPEELSRSVQLLLAGFVLLANAIVYWLVWRRRERLKPDPLRDVHHLRAATVSDLREAASWIRSAEEAALWAGFRVSYPVDLNTLENDLEFEFTSSLALVDEGTLVAFGQLVPKTEGRRHIARLIVNPTRRGCGLGRVLAEHLVRTAWDLNCSRISLNVDRSNLAALSLYRGLGFVEVERPADEPESSSLYLEHAPRSPLKPVLVGGNGQRRLSASR